MEDAYQITRTFGPAWGASGVEGFFGEGYWFHALMPGCDFTGMTFVAKTTTLNANAGNMRLADDYTPRDWFPKCVYVGARGFWNGAAVNAVGLSGPGAEPLLRTGKWQDRRDPFMLSFMSVKPTKGERLQELAGFVELVRAEKPLFDAHFGLQINLSCPNVGVTHGSLLDEAYDARLIAKALNVPIYFKVACSMPPRDFCEIAEFSHVAGMVTSNTIRLGDMLTEKECLRIFGTRESPLTHLRPEKPDPACGGVSGLPLLEMNLAFIQEVRRLGCRAYINASGGVMSKRVVRMYKEAGAHSVSVGSVAFLRPWRVRGIIREAYRMFGQ